MYSTIFHLCVVSLPHYYTTPLLHYYTTTLLHYSFQDLAADDSFFWPCTRCASIAAISLPSFFSGWLCGDALSSGLSLAPGLQLAVGNRTEKLSINATPSLPTSRRPYGYGSPIALDPTVWTPSVVVPECGFYGYMLWNVFSCYVYQYAAVLVHLMSASCI
jgi:hypothetical protein